MMTHDSRRCRRCKRKRLDDEPPEVMQYKTCAKCRIIERNKKNSRKPLAEETMLYGLKQFKEQSLSGNFMEEEGLLKDEFFRRFHNKPFNYEHEINEVLSNPNYVSPVVQASAPTISNNSPQQYSFKSATIPIQGFSSAPINLNNHNTFGQQRTQFSVAANQQQPPRNPNYSQPPQQHIQTQQKPPNYQSNVNKVSKPVDLQTNYYKRKQLSDFGPLPGEFETNEDDIFLELSRLGNKGEETSKPVGDIDPYAFKNVFSDFQQFLLSVLQKKKQNENITNLVYLKEFNEEFTSTIGKFDSTIGKSEFNNSNMTRVNEKQLRNNVLNNLKSLYIEPIIAVVDLEYNQLSSNINDFKNTNSIKSFYNFSLNDDQFTDVRDRLVKIKNSSIYFNYNRKHNLFIIKVNHILYKPTNTKYSIEIKVKVNDILKKLRYERSLPPPYPPSHIYSGIIDYNLFTARIVYDRLIASLDLFSSGVQDFLKSMNKEDFISDFINFDIIFHLEESRTNVVVPEHDEEEEDEEEDEEEEDEDEEEEEEDENRSDDASDSDDPSVDGSNDEGNDDDLDESILESKGLRVRPAGEHNAMDIDGNGNGVPLLETNPSALPIGQANHINAILNAKPPVAYNRPVAYERPAKESTAEILDPVFKPDH